ncbi:hypothetical protein N2152v2_004128 [Parachlorella kessleri]
MDRIAVLQAHLLPLASVQSDSQGLLFDPCSASVAVGAAAVLVGGMVLDLQACPSTDSDVRRGGSVPGHVTQAPGGVARNVAESLARLCRGVGRPGPVLLSAVGRDLAGQALISHMQSLGLSTAGILQVAGSSTPTVAVVFDRSGEVAACVADVDLLEQAVTPPFLRQHRSLLAAAPVVMVDGNLSPAALEAACHQAAAAGVPVWFEPVSQPKSIRASQVLHLLTYISPNEGELVAMAQAVQRGTAQLEPNPPGILAYPSSSASRDSSNSKIGPLPAEVAAAVEPLLHHTAVLLRAGVKHIVLTLGPVGAALCTPGPDNPSSTICVQHLPALPAKVVNCSGAGDCLVAGCLFGLTQGRTPLQALACGVAASHAAVESQHNVPPQLSAAAVERGAREVLAQRAAAVVRI